VHLPENIQHNFLSPCIFAPGTLKVRLRWLQNCCIIISVHKICELRSDTQYHFCLKERIMKAYPVYIYNTTPDSDSEEYNDEATMVESNLETMRLAIDCIDEIINKKDNVPEWVQEKIAVTKSMLTSVCDYMKSKQTVKKA